ncbi:MAG: Gfo/Idh/MocA family oxidoreductase [Intrasporangium sp.]|uniref:Gfo/Idh/MocA family protein n=1 Tax=Intrasporangium sp. TaxID=1925024 RepID=UPI00264A0ED0|nr:Gfo/Idh/MocA family oxidoreductase [Intrasporangium sp.]MDN5796888.1 Gfo/Idh/MocA family oxidoreductase [Intrasporangium sp.]
MTADSTGPRPAALPAPRVADPRDAPAIRWGILGPGGIARAFAAAVRQGTTSVVVAVGSRDAQRARAFAQDFGIERAHGSYADLVRDDRVDAVHVSSPHSEHHAHAILALQAGKPVLVEKAFTRNAPEAREVIETARRAGLLVAEAMWSRYLPHYDVVRRAVTDGLVGEVVHIVADHSQRLHPGGPPRLAAPELAGGALLDLGVYPVSFADHLLGRPSGVTARATLTERGVDATTAIVLSHAGGAQAVLSASMLAAGPCTATVTGTLGRLELEGRFYAPTTIRWRAPDGTVLDERDGGPASHAHGFAYEAAEFARGLVSGRLATESMPHAATLRVMQTMDEVRRQVGVTYPGE